MSKPSCKTCPYRYAYPFEGSGVYCGHDTALAPTADDRTCSNHPDMGAWLDDRSAAGKPSMGLATQAAPASRFATAAEIEADPSILMQRAKPDATRGECGKAGCQAEKIGLEDRAAAAEAEAKRQRAALEHIDSAFNRSIHTLSDTERQAWTITRKALHPEAPDA
jgi:hypothetical protein